MDRFRPNLNRMIWESLETGAVCRNDISNWQPWIVNRVSVQSNSWRDSNRFDPVPSNLGQFDFDWSSLEYYVGRAGRYRIQNVIISSSEAQDSSWIQLELITRIEMMNFQAADESEIQSSGSHFHEAVDDALDWNLRNGPRRLPSFFIEMMSR